MRVGDFFSLALFVALMGGFGLPQPAHALTAQKLGLFGFEKNEWRQVGGTGVSTLDEDHPANGGLPGSLDTSTYQDAQRSKRVMIARVDPPDPAERPVPGMSTVHFHAETGAGTRLRVELIWKGRAQSPKRVLPPNAPAGWRYLHITPRNLDAAGTMWLRFTSFPDGGGCGCNANVHATYYAYNTEPPTPAGCAPALAQLVAPGCDVLRSDRSVSANPKPAWGSIDCVSDRRHERIRNGGDGHRLAAGRRSAEDSYRRLRLFGGEGVEGDGSIRDRCELGRNWHLEDTFAVYREGQRRLTFLSLRFPPSFPLGTDDWQTVVQMKPSQPAAAAPGPPLLELQAVDGRLRLGDPVQEFWNVRVRKGRWIRIALDVTYSQYADSGRVKAYVDANGDGDAADVGEQSPTVQMSTLKREKSGGYDDGIPAGDSVPAHLRSGIYHDSDIGCRRGCAIHLDNVQVVKPG